MLTISSRRSVTGLCYLILAVVMVTMVLTSNCNGGEARQPAGCPESYSVPHGDYPQFYEPARVFVLLTAHGPLVRHLLADGVRGFGREVFTVIVAGGVTLAATPVYGPGHALVLGALAGASAGALYDALFKK